MPPRGRGNYVGRGGRRASGTSSSTLNGPVIDGLRMESEIIANAIAADALMAAGRIQHLDLATQLPHPESEAAIAVRTMPLNTSSEPQVAFVVVPYLPKIAYKDSEDKSTMSDGYISQQRKVLDFELTKAIDDMTPYEARKLTEDIAPNKEPAANEALRLCYYMRQWDFSTYARIKDGSIMLYVIDRGDGNRSMRDVKYWQQNFVTNEVEYRAPNTANVDRMMRHLVGEVDMLDVLQGSGRTGTVDFSLPASDTTSVVATETTTETETEEETLTNSSASQVAANHLSTLREDLDQLDMGGHRPPRRTQ
ncbi:hypothetical protein IQ07DRAFT_669801 [Pyrenochaeta sp. DS3sAY3a]|nr:hypothetical protein IQ07DRAFT_669801 [Pyrenochaeta sp. DS3sAY3a]